MIAPVSVPNNDQMLIIAQKAIPNIKANPIGHVKLKSNNYDKRTIAHLYFFIINEKYLIY